MSRFTLLVVLLSLANGCSAVPGIVRSRSIVAPTLKKLSLEDRDIPVEASTISAADADSEPEPNPQAETHWSPDDLMVGSAIKANLDGQHVALSQRWEPAFDSSQAPQESVEAEDSATPTRAVGPASVGFKLLPLAVWASAKTNAEPGQSVLTKGIQCDPSGPDNGDCRDANLIAPHVLKPLPVEVQVANPVVQSAYSTPVAESTACDDEAALSAHDPSDYPAAESKQNPLDQLISQLQSANHLHLRRVCLCRQVDGFGQIVEFPDAQFAAGEDILIYCEVDNFTSRMETSPSGTYHRASLSGSYLVINGDGEVVAEHEYPLVNDISRAERDDFFLVFPAQIPLLEPGRYRMYLVVHDELGQELVAHAEPIQFQIALTGQAQR